MRDILVLHIQLMMPADEPDRVLYEFYVKEAMAAVPDDEKNTEECEAYMARACSGTAPLIGHRTCCRLSAWRLGRSTAI